MTSTTNATSTARINSIQKNDVFRRRLNSKASQVMMQEFKITSDEFGVSYTTSVVPLGETEATRKCIKSKNTSSIVSIRK